MCLLRALHKHGRFYSKSGEVRLGVSVGRLGIGVAYLQLSFSVCYRRLFARAWWVSMEKALPQKQVPSRRGAHALRTLPRPNPSQSGIIGNSKKNRPECKWVQMSYP